tara:strand:- start:23783 stop:24571 length:789 start_codon:yes stop_codon:yes gene_type:complete
MSKNIIYSIWSDLTEEHMSVNDYKKESFKKYKDKLIELQKQYAYHCNADYELFNPTSTDYVNVQFDKIFKLEELTKTYDKVVYFDLDVIPKTERNIFNAFNFDDICVFDYSVLTWHPKSLKYFSGFIRDNEQVPPMDRNSKVCAKNAMLLLDDIVGNDNITNTGVLCANKKAMDSLKFSQRINMMDNKLQLAIEDNLYPKVVSEPWIRNNEIYLSYLLERYKIKFNNIGLQWNYILDDLIRKSTSAAHLVHQVNKEFHVTIQ